MAGQVQMVGLPFTQGSMLATSWIFLGRSTPSIPFTTLCGHGAHAAWHSQVHCPTGGLCALKQDRHHESHCAGTLGCYTCLSVALFSGHQGLVSGLPPPPPPFTAQETPYQAVSQMLFTWPVSPQSIHTGEVNATS